MLRAIITIKCFVFINKKKLNSIINFWQWFQILQLFKFSKYKVKIKKNLKLNN